MVCSIVAWTDLAVAVLDEEHSRKAYVGYQYWLVEGLQEDAFAVAVGRNAEVAP